MFHNIVLFLLVAAVYATLTNDPQPNNHCYKSVVSKIRLITKLPPKCRKNEVWKECGTACQPSCLKPKPICHKKCARGCMCKPGMLRNSKGKCIESCDC